MPHTLSIAIQRAQTRMLTTACHLPGEPWSSKCHTQVQAHRHLNRMHKRSGLHCLNVNAEKEYVFPAQACKERAT